MVATARGTVALPPKRLELRWDSTSATMNRESRMRNQRRRLRMRLQEVASKAKLDVPNLSRMERGLVPALPYSRRLARILKLRPEELQLPCAGD